MKMAIENGTNRVLFVGVESIEIDKVILSNGAQSLGQNLSTCFLVDVERPTPFHSDAYEYDAETNSLLVVDQAMIDEKVQQRADSVLARRSVDAKAEASRRIFAVYDQNAQMNLTAAYAAGLLDAGQQATYLAGLAWIASVRGAWQSLAAGELDLYDDTNWPEPTQAMIDLGAAF